MKNQLKAMLKRGKPQLGTFVSIGHPEVAELIGHANYDWVCFDTEHSPMSIETVENMMQAMSFSKTVPIVRVAWNDQVLIKRALDIGAYGILVPWVNSREEAERAVQAVRYPPTGTRGFGPRRAILGDPHYEKTADKEVLLSVQIETQKAIDHLDDILSVKGIDAAFIGPYDLSVSLGIIGQFGHKKFRAAIETFLQSAQRHGVAAGIVAIDDIKERVSQGFTMLLIANDFFLLKNSASDTINRARKILGQK
jgi:2-keto-3-deoxy-L-rhamnonate aldolase RhmA